MYRAFVEADTGECLRVIRDGGGTGGKAVLAFLIPLSVYCLGTKDDELRAWFSHLDSVTDKSLCDLCHPLERAYYTGEWNYTEDEYQFFLRRSPGLQMPEENFKKAVRQVSEKWTDIEAVIRSIEALLPLLAGVTEETYWYKPEDTIPGFQDLLTTLTLLSQRDARRIRIKFV